MIKTACEAMPRQEEQEKLKNLIKWRKDNYEVFSGQCKVG